MLESQESAIRAYAGQQARAHCDGGEDVLEAERCHFDGAVEQEREQRPDRRIPWRASPLLDHVCSDGYDCDLYRSTSKSDQANCMVH